MRAPSGDGGWRPTCDSNDFICSTELTVTADNLEAGGIRFTCSSNGTTAALLFRHLQ